MAQHILIQNSANKNVQKICQSIRDQFRKGISIIRSSLKYQEIYEENFKESENDIVFQTWRTINQNRENFEIHFNSQKEKITKIYLIK